jgi:hypothetical protein
MLYKTDSFSDEYELLTPAFSAKLINKQYKKCPDQKYRALFNYGL